MSASPTTTDARPLFLVARSGPDGQVHESWVTTEAQAWELVRTQLLDDRRALDGTTAELDYALALEDLDGEGPQPYGWWSQVAGREYWYCPQRVERPEGLTVGETALLLALAAAG